MSEIHSVMASVKEIGGIITNYVIMRFSDPDNSEISYHYLLLNFFAFFFLLRFGLAFDFIKRQKVSSGVPSSARETLRSLFSRDVFFSRSFLMDAGIWSVALVVNATLAILVSKFFMDSTDFFTKQFELLAGLLGHHPFSSNHFWIENLVFTGVFFVLWEFFYYGTHYFYHKIPILWQFHKIHHSATRLSFMTDNRFHFVEIFIHNLFVGFSAGLSSVLCSYLFGSVPTGIVVSGIMVQNAIFSTLTLAQHSNWWFSFGPLDHVIMSPAGHIIHHDSDPKHYDTNFGATTSILDILFGTFTKPEPKPAQTVHLGLGSTLEEIEAWEHAPLATLILKPFADATNIVLGKEPKPIVRAEKDREKKAS